MNAPQLGICRKCGGVMKRISEKNKSPLVFECRECKHREWSEIQISPPWPADESTAQHVRMVIYKKPGKSDMEYVRALRKIDQELNTLPIRRVVEIVQSSSFIDMGVYGIKEAKKIIKKAKSYGLIVTLENPEKHFAENNEKRSFFKRFNAPVTVGDNGEDFMIIPFYWILVGFVIIVMAILLFLLI